MTFRNVMDDRVRVAYGDLRADEPDGEFELAVGGSRTITTQRDLVLYIAVGSNQSQTDFVRVPRTCGDDAPDHPRVAPAAGLSGR